MTDELDSVKMQLKSRGAGSFTEPMGTSNRVGLVGLVITVLSPAVAYFLGGWFIAALFLVVGIGLLLGWVSAEVHGKFVGSVAGSQPPLGTPLDEGAGAEGAGAETP